MSRLIDVTQAYTALYVSLLGSIKKKYCSENLFVYTSSCQMGSLGVLEPSPTSHVSKPSRPKSISIPAGAGKLSCFSQKQLGS